MKDEIICETSQSEQSITDSGEKCFLLFPNSHQVIIFETLTKLQNATQGLYHEVKLWKGITTPVAKWNDDL